jgi:hypothetical protein
VSYRPAAARLHNHKRFGISTPCGWCYAHSRAPQNEQRRIQAGFGGPARYNSTATFDADRPERGVHAASTCAFADASEWKDAFVRSLESKWSESRAPGFEGAVVTL